MEKTYRPYRLQKNKYKASWKLSKSDKIGFAIAAATIAYVAIRVALS